MSTGGTIRHRLSDVFNNPVVGIVGSVASVISLLLAIYFYVASERVPDLVFSVSPNKVQLVDSHEESKISVTFQGQRVLGNVTSVAVAVWNRGSASIRTENVLKPIVIFTDPKTRILKATVKAVSRDVTGFKIGQTGLDAGQVLVGWDILEKGDGGLIEIVHNGGLDVQPRVQGIIEGQQTITTYLNKMGISSISEQYDALLAQHQRIRLFVPPMIAVFSVGGFFLVREVRKRSSDDSTNRKAAIVLPILLLCIVALLAAMFYLSSYSPPPLGL